MAKKKIELTLEEKLEQALVKKEDWPYEIPKDWVWVKLEYLIKLLSGRDLKVSECNDQAKGIPYIMGASNIVNDKFNIQRWTEKPEVIGIKNDILLTVKGTIGKIYIQIEREVHLSRQVMGIRPLNIRVYHKYIYYYLLSYIKKIQAKSRGVIPGIGRNDILNIKIPYCSLNKQKKIINIIEEQFEKLDRAKELIQNAIDSFEDRKSAILHKAFTGELTAKWREENGVSLDSWEEKKFKDFCLVKRGFDLPKKDRRSGNYPLISSSGISDYIHEFKINGPGIIIGRSGSIGKVHYIADDYWPLNTTLYSQDLCGNFPKYIYYYFLQFPFLRYGSSTAVPTLNRNKFLSELVRIPTVTEQIEIAKILGNYFQTEQHAIDNISKKVDIENIKKSILAKAFRGELTKSLPTDETAFDLLKEIL